MKTLMSDPQLPVPCTADVSLPEVPALREALGAVHRQETPHSVHWYLLLHLEVCSEFIFTYVEYIHARWCKSQMFMNYIKKKKSENSISKIQYFCWWKKNLELIQVIRSIYKLKTSSAPLSTTPMKWKTQFKICWCFTILTHLLLFVSN